MNRLSLNKVVLLGLFVALNFIGAYIALILRLPIYLDCLGTVLASLLFGPLIGAFCGLASGLVNGIIDYYSIFFIPVGLLIGFLTGLVNKKGLLKGRKIFFGVFIVTIFSSILASIIVAMLFGGITSSGSSYIVQILSSFGIDLTLSVLITQIFTDYLDKFIVITLMLKIYGYLPHFNLREDMNGKIQ